MKPNDVVLSWSAPIVPSCSLAGISLGMHVSDLEKALSNYVCDESERLYGFVGSPVLRMERKISPDGAGGYGFYVVDLELTNWRLYYSRSDHPGIELRALHVLVDEWKVYAVKAWMFECLAEEDMPVNSYQGKLPEGLGLGNLVCELLPYTALEYDGAEEWFYTDKNYGGVEVGGCGSDLDDRPDQRITALTVIKKSPFGSG